MAKYGKNVSASAVKARVEYMKDHSAEIKIIDIPEDKRIYSKYDKAICITIHGEPITDGRPRHQREQDGTYNPYKEFLMKIFSPFYYSDELIKKTCLTTPYAFIMKLYYLPEKKLSKEIGVDIVNEDHVALKQKDNDNAEKIHWDVFQDIKYHIIIDDRFITHNMTTKIYSMRPRAEIQIHYPSEQMINANSFLKIYQKKILSGSSFRRLHITSKFIFDMKETKEKHFPRVFFDNVDAYNITVNQASLVLKKCYTAAHIKALTEYLGVKPTNRENNTKEILESIEAGRYPVTRKKIKRRLE